MDEQNMGAPMDPQMDAPMEGDMPAAPAPEEMPAEAAPAEGEQGMA